MRSFGSNLGVVKNVKIQQATAKVQWQIRHAERAVSAYF